jgi:hypothetical protein
MVDSADLKSAARKGVRVQVPPRVPTKHKVTIGFTAGGFFYSYEYSWQKYKLMYNQT